MTPDFKYFLLGLSHAHSHSLRGLFTFCLPVGIVAWLMFQLVMKRPVTLLAPRSEATRLWALASTPVRLGWRSILAAAAAIIVGAASHLLWDTFTHVDGWGVRHIPALSRSLASFQGYQVNWFKILQHGSTVAGLLLLSRVYLHWRRKAEPLPTTPALPLAWKRLSLAVIVVVPTVAAAIYSGASAAAITNLPSLQPFAWRFVTSGLGFGILALVLYSLVTTLAMARPTTTPR